MWRKLFSRLTAVSFVLCLLTVAWWVRTGSKVDEVAYQREDIELLRMSGHDGKVVLTHALYDPSRARLGSGKLAWDSAAFNASQQSHSPYTAAMSFSYRSQPRPTGGRESMLILPLWMVTALFAMLPICWAGTRMRRNSKAKKVKKGE